MSNTQYVNLKNNPHIPDLEFLEEEISKFPRQKITSNVVETSERIRVFPKDSPFPGKHKFSRSPYMYEIAMELSPQSNTEVVNVCKAAQMGATANSTESLILFCIAENPMPVLAMVPTMEFLKKWDSSRIMPMIENSGLKEKLTATYKKNSQHGGNGDAVGRKTWPGGKLDIITFGQTNQLRNQSYAIAILEDAEELVMTMQKGGGQGDFKKIAFARTMTFAGRRKILDISTPIYKQNSHIWKEFLKGDQRYYYINCPECGHSQRLQWKNLKFERDQHNHVIKESVFYECQNDKCHYHMKEEEKEDFLLCEELGGTAHWVPHNLEKAELLTKSYQFSALYAGAGFDTWYDLAIQFVAAQDDPEALQAFINLKLGEPYDNRSEAPPAESCHILKGNSYKKGYLPNKIEGEPIFTMIGADIQAGNKRDGKYLKGKESRIEASLWGFGLNNRSWLLDHYIITGETTDWRSGAFKKFRQMIVDEVFPIHPVKIFIDSGYQTDEVRKFCNGALNVFPIMGMAKIKKGYFNKVDLPGFSSGTGGPLPMYELNTNPLKRRIYNALGYRQDPISNEYPSGYLMFPADLEAKYFEQLTSERPEPIMRNNVQVGFNWTAHGANEALDCSCYAFEGKEVYIEETSLLHGEKASNHRFFWEWAKNKHGFPSPSIGELMDKQERLFQILYQD